MSEQIVVMGVSGVGKTTIATGLAKVTGWEFAEGDDFHPQANIDKMHSGHPLTDEDRAPWLRALRDWMAEEAAAGRSAFVTCSALKRSYRDVLRGSGPHVRFLDLVADEAMVRERLSHRTGHFMPPALLQSQFDTLERLSGDELRTDSVEVSVAGEPDDTVHAALLALGLAGS